MAKDYYSPAEFEAIGRRVAKIAPSNCERIKWQRFVGFFGVDPLIVSILWSMIMDAEYVRLVNNPPEPEHLLWALLFLKCYQTEPRNAALVGCDEKTFRKWCWLMLECIADLDSQVVRVVALSLALSLQFTNSLLLPLQIRWENRKIGDTGDSCLVYIDGIDFATHQMLKLNRRQRKKWFTYKHRHFGIKYEVGTNIKTGDIVHYVGPFRAAHHDVTVFRAFLKDRLPLGERVMADPGYRGDHKVFTQYDCRTCQEKRALKSVGARHETVNGRVRFFDSMKYMWRHDKKKHHIAFRSSLVCAQLNHENGRPVYECYGYSDPYARDGTADWDFIVHGK